MNLTISIILFILSIVLIFISSKRAKLADKLFNETDALLKQIDLDDQVLVQKKWIKSLIEHAETFEEKAKHYEYSNLTNHINDKIHMEAMSLMGYAKSAKYIK